MPGCFGHAGIFHVPAPGMPRLAPVIVDGGGGELRWRLGDGDGDDGACGRDVALDRGDGDLDADRLGVDDDCAAAARSARGPAVAMQPAMATVSIAASANPRVRRDIPRGRRDISTPEGTGRGDGPRGANPAKLTEPAPKSH
jgi:hypothetical protein